MKTVGLIQARMGSVRLPGKVLREIEGRPIVGHIVDRMKRVSGIDEIILATGSGQENDLLEQWGRDNGIPVVRHPNDDDIAGRLARALDISGADVFVKANGDCPLLDVEIVEAALDLFHSIPDCDAVTNKLKSTFPLGFSIELLGSRCLRWCDQNLHSDEQRELTVKYILDRPEDFVLGSLEGDEDHSRYNLTVDTPEDFEFVSRIFDALYGDGGYFGWPEVQKYLAQQDHLPDCAYL